MRFDTTWERQGKFIDNIQKLKTIIGTRITSKLDVDHEILFKVVQRESGYVLFSSEAKKAIS